MAYLVLALIAYSLATFGAVLPTAWSTASLMMLFTVSIYLVVRIIRRSSLPLTSVAAYVLICLILSLMHVRIALGFAGGVLMWLAASDSSRSLLKFFKVLLVFGLGEAFLGLVQYFVSPGWIFGYNNLAYRVSGTLINHNHYSGLLEMLIPIAFGLSYIAAQRDDGMARAYLYLLASAFMGLALVFSVSRMGILVFFCTTLFTGILLRTRQSHRRYAAAFSVIVFGLVAAGALWIGLDAVTKRYSGILSEEAVLREGRFLIFRDTVKMLIAHPLGVGSDNYQYFFRQYQTFRPELLVDHAHNDYLETAAEWGIPIAIAFWVGIGATFVRAVRGFFWADGVENRGILLSASGAIFAMLVHSLADFNLQIPVNAMLFFSFIGVSLAVPLTRRMNNSSFSVAASVR